MSFLAKIKEWLTKIIGIEDDPYDECYNCRLLRQMLAEREELIGEQEQLLAEQSELCIAQGKQNQLQSELLGESLPPPSASLAATLLPEAISCALLPGGPQGRRYRVFHITVDLLADTLLQIMKGAQPCVYEKIGDPLPADCQIARIFSHHLCDIMAVVLWSSTWPELQPNESVPVMRVAIAARKIQMVDIPKLFAPMPN